jgi:uncharacterized protein YndB with AHSA1/START domain
VHDFVSRTVIRATPEKVWEILTNASGYAEWNPEIGAIEGGMASGTRFHARVKIANGAIRPVSMRVTAFAPPSRMEWTGGLPLGLFKSRRLFTVTPADDGGVDFRMLVTMSGPLASLMVKATGDRQAEIDSFSSALRARAEQS